MIAYVCAGHQQGVVAEWSACLHSDRKVAGSIPATAVISSPFLSKGPRH